MTTLSASTAGEIQFEYDAAKREKRLGKGSKKSVTFDEAPPPPKNTRGKSAGGGMFDVPPPPKPAPRTRIIRDDEDSLDAPTSLYEKAQSASSTLGSLGSWFGGSSPEDDEERQVEEEMKRLANKCEMINEYYAAFQKVCPPRKKQWTPEKDSEMACDAELARIRNILNQRGSKEAVTALYCSGCSVIEKATMQWGINPWELQLQGFGQAVTMNLKQMEPELTEASIELRHWFAADWKWRLVYKTASFANVYSELKKNPGLMEQIEKARQAAAQPGMPTPPPPQNTSDTEATEKPKAAPRKR